MTYSYLPTQRWEKDLNLSLFLVEKKVRLLEWTNKYLPPHTPFNKSRKISWLAQEEFLGLTFLFYSIHPVSTDVADNVKLHSNPPKGCTFLQLVSSSWGFSVFDCAISLCYSSRALCQIDDGSEDNLRFKFWFYVFFLSVPRGPVKNFIR